MTKIIQQGAEAIILKEKNKIIKRRAPKSYRLKELDDKIRCQRTKKEAKLLEKASKVIYIPKVINVNEHSHEIELEFIRGKRLSDHLNSFPENEQLKIAEIIGKQLAKLHSIEIIHSDLTTSNIILEDKTKKIFFIDFGLGYGSNRREHRAVDLYLFKEALEAKHFQNCEKLFKAFLKGYKAIMKSDYESIFQQLKKVEKRGRYKDKY
jgi:Kae1-associated kinase Bud32